MCAAMLLRPRRESTATRRRTLPQLTTGGDAVILARALATCAAAQRRYVEIGDDVDWSQLNDPDTYRKLLRACFKTNARHRRYRKWQAWLA
jgi:hypothetical protein